MSTKLTQFSYAVLVLVGEGGAGAHDLVRMLREGQPVFWAAATSQWYAEPKRLAQLGYLHAKTAPGRTHERTHYTLTDAGREALREWLGQPSAFTRIQCEPVVRLLGAEYAEPEALLASLQAPCARRAPRRGAADSRAAGTSRRARAPGRPDRAGGSRSGRSARAAPPWRSCAHGARVASRGQAALTGARFLSIGSRG